MSYPVGPLLQAMAQRILANLDYIEQHAPPRGAERIDDVPFADTQLLISLLGVLVFPHERTPGALAQLVNGYGRINDVVEVLHPASGKIEIQDEDGQPQTVDAASLAELPRLLRNSIAHFNILPIEENGRFGGIRVWNIDDTKCITFVADIRFEKLRAFAQHVLRSLADGRSGLTLDDPADPMTVLQSQPVAAKRRKPPRVVDHVWERFLLHYGGNREAAQGALGRLLERAARELRTPVLESGNGESAACGGYPDEPQARLDDPPRQPEA